tara:strand:+ start:24625 stop:27501 length:2877 start_codon:yes stop_codon:yes gene_type:complete
MSQKYGNMIRQQQSGVNLSDLLMKTVVNEFVKDLFDTSDDKTDPDTGLTAAQTINVQKHNQSQDLAGVDTYVRDLASYERNYKDDIAALKNTITYDIDKYTDPKTGKVNYNQMNVDLNTKTKAYKDDIIKSFANDDGKFGWYTYTDLDGEHTKYDKRADNMANKVVKNVGNMIDQMVIAEESKNNLQSSYQDLTFKLEKISDEGLDYKSQVGGGAGSVLNLFDKVKNSLSQSQAAGLATPPAMTRSLKEIESYRDALYQASQYDTSEDLGLQLGDKLGNLPYMFDESEVAKMTDEQKEDYNDIKGRLQVGNKAVPLKEVANEIDRLLKSGGASQIRQAEFLMNKLLPGETIKTNSIKLKNTELEDLQKEVIGKINSSRKSQNSSYDLLVSDFTAISDESAMYTDRGLIFTKKVTVSDAQKKKGAVDVNDSGNLQIRGLAKDLVMSLKPLDKRNQTDLDFSTYDEEMPLLDDASQQMAKAMLIGKSTDGRADRMFLTSADGKIKYGFNYSGEQKGVIDITTLDAQGKRDFTKFMMEEVKTTGGIGLLNTANNDGFWKVQAFGKGGAKTAWDGEGNEHLQGREAEVFGHINNLMALKYNNANMLRDNYTKATNIKEQINKLEGVDDDDNKAETKPVSKGNKNAKGKKDPKTPSNRNILDKDFDLDLGLEAQDEENLLTTGRELNTLLVAIDDLKDENPNLTKILESIDRLDGLDKDVLKDKGYHDDGLTEALGMTASIGLDRLKKGYEKEEKYAHQIFDAAKEMGMKVPWNVGNRADGGVDIYNDLLEKGEESKYYNSQLMTMAQHMKGIRTENDEYALPIREYMKRRDTVNPQTMSGDYFRPKVLGGTYGKGFGLGAVKSRMKEDRGVGNPNQALQEFMTGKDRLQSDKLALQNSLNRLLVDPKNNAKQIKQTFAKLNQEAEAKQRQFDWQVSDLKLTEDVALQVLKDIAFESALASSE